MMNVLWLKQLRRIITVKATDLRALIVLTFIYLGEVCLQLTLTCGRCQLEAAISVIHKAVSQSTEAFDCLMLCSLALW